MRNIYKIFILPTILTTSYTLAWAQNISVKIQTPGGKTEFCQSRTIVLTAYVNAPADDIISQVWEGDLSMVEKNMGSILILKPGKAGTFQFSLRIKDKFGNEASDQITISVKPIFKPTLKIEKGNVTVSINPRTSSYNLSYYINGKEVFENEFKQVTKKGTYHVIATTADGCSATSNTIEIR